MKFKIEPEIFEKFPELHIGIVTARDIDNHDRSEIGNYNHRPSSNPDGDPVGAYCQRAGTLSDSAALIFERAVSKRDIGRHSR